MLDKSRGKRITRRMDALDITYEQLAELCGVSVKAVYKWTAGNNLPSERVVQLSRALECSTDFLLLGVLSQREDPLLELVAGLPDHDKTALFNYLDALYNKK